MRLIRNWLTVMSILPLKRLKHSRNTPFPFCEMEVSVQKIAVERRGKAPVIEGTLLRLLYVEERRAKGQLLEVSDRGSEVCPTEVAGR